MSDLFIVAGTRPEAIKLAPVYLAAKDHPRIRPIWVSTGQHREMLAAAEQAFAITPDHHLDVMVPNQTLGGLTIALMQRLDALLEQRQPDMVVVQGDTTTAMTAALSSFYRRIPVAHVEAGLRSFDMENPFPEEGNRRVISQVADLHFAPTAGSARNLIESGIASGRIVVTGNTVVDALAILTAGTCPHATPAALPPMAADHRMLLVTSHRRETWGDALTRICRALVAIRDRFDDVEVVYPLHLNPNVRRTVFPLLGNQPRIHLIEPVDYFAFVELMRRAELILTDSGGVQEEAPCFDVPVLVLRRLTERPEAVEQGLAKIVGSDTDAILNEATRLLSDRDAYARMTGRPNPFGDGHAAPRIVTAIDQFLAGEHTLLPRMDSFAA